MSRQKNLTRRAALLLSLVLLCAPAAAAQNKASGGVRGRVRVETGSASGIAVTVRQGDREVAHATTNSKGEFEVRGLAPGTYGLTLRKAGLQVGRMEGVEVKAGKTVSAGGKLYLPVDEGAIAHLRGSVFDAEGRSVPNVRVELALVQADGTLRKLDSRVTNRTGTFAFRLSPDVARYRLSAKANGMQASKDVDVDSAAIFRVALNLESAAP
jgi:hypothetical protein